MNATFNFKVTIEGGSVGTKVNTSEINDLDLKLLQTISKIMEDAEKRVKNQLNKYYGMTAAATSETEAVLADTDTGMQAENTGTED